MLIFIAKLFTKCSFNKESKKIENQYNLIKEHVKVMDSDEIINLMDEDSGKYYQELIDILRLEYVIEMGIHGEKYEAELMTKLLCQLMNSPNILTSSLKDLTVTEMVFYSQVLGMGILNPYELDRTTFKEVEKINGNNATVIIKFKAHPSTNHYLDSRYKFTKEDKVWKINIPSTFRFGEKILKEKWRQHGGEVDIFIKNYLHAGNMKIKYKLKK